MFLLGLPWVEKILRPILVYVFLVVGLRIAGKRELAQLNPFDLVVLLTLSNAVQNAIIGDDNTVTGGMIGATTLLAVNYVVVRFMYGHEQLEQLVEGSADMLITAGKIHTENCRRELITMSNGLFAAEDLVNLTAGFPATTENGGTSHPRGTASVPSRRRQPHRRTVE